MEFTSGPLIAMELQYPSDPSASPVQLLRQLCGPVDSEIARTLQPHTLRARFGVDRVCSGGFDLIVRRSEMLFIAQTWRKMRTWRQSTSSEYYSRPCIVFTFKWNSVYYRIELFFVNSVDPKQDLVIWLVGV